MVHEQKCDDQLVRGMKVAKESPALHCYWGESRKVSRMY